MNRLVLSLSLLLLFDPSSNAQDNKAFDGNASAVRATVTNYIEGYFTGDAQRMEQTPYPHYVKHVIHAHTQMDEMTGRQVMKNVRLEGIPDLPAASKAEKVTVLVAGDIASAKLVTPGWTDYMALSKVNGEWKILSVVQRID
jgi:hypothetical protein